MAAAGERRWSSSTRRGGMTVLGKVVVPKPINLPSQRLENHGLDPNISIVPKGTINWGASTRSSSSVNAWGTSSINNEVRISSDGPVGGRPSSGGSGTRPSTAGSEKSYDTAWSSSGRPSSASGVSAENDTSMTASRPRSSETRPASSQLSRFASSASENPDACLEPGTQQKPGVTSSKPSGFTLSTGDFPSLGSDKCSTVHKQQGHDNSHGRPGSSSGRPSSRDGSPESTCAASDKDTVNIWKRGDSPNSPGECAPPEKWQMTAQHQPIYTTTNMSSQHFRPWYPGPVQSQPGATWYRNHTAVGPYGPMGFPGGYPLDPQIYHQAQIAPIPYSQTTVMPEGSAGYANAGGFHLPGHPIIPARPGIRPVPMAYNGYYDASTRFHKSNEFNISVMGAPLTFGVYDTACHEQSANPDSSNSGEISKPFFNQSAANCKGPVDYASGNRGPFKLLLKHHHQVSGKDDEDKKEHAMEGKQPLSRPTSQESSVGENDLDVVGGVGGMMELQKSDLGENSLGSSKDHTTVTHNHKNMESNGVDHKARKIEVRSKPRFYHCSPSEPSIASVDRAHAMSGTNDGQFDNRPPSIEQSKERRLNAFSTNVGSRSNSISCSTDAVIPHDNHIETPGTKISVGSEKLRSDSSLTGKLDSSEVADKVTFRNYKRGSKSGEDEDRSKGKVKQGEDWRRKGSEPRNFVSDVVSNMKDSDIRAKESEVCKDYEKPSNVSRKAGGEPYRTTYASDCDAQLRKHHHKEEERVRNQKNIGPVKVEELNQQATTERLVTSGTLKEDKILIHKSINPIITDQRRSEKVKVSLNSDLNNSPIISDIPNTKPPVETTPDLSSREDSTEPPVVTSVMEDRENSALKQRKGGALKQKSVGFRRNRGSLSDKNNESQSQLVIAGSDVQRTVVLNGSASNGLQSNRSHTEVEDVSVAGNERSYSDNPPNTDETSFMVGTLKLIIPTVADGSTSIPAAETSEPIVSPFLQEDRSMASQQPTTNVSGGVEAKDALDAAYKSKGSSQSPHDGNPHVKIQHWRKQRAPQKSRSTEMMAQGGKLHANKAVWAAVPPIKCDVISSEESNQKSGDEGADASKSKKIEMESYVPKQVARELSQTVPLQLLPDALVSEVTSSQPTERAEGEQCDKSIGKYALSSSDTGPVTHVKKDEGKKSRHGKPHMLWRQRGSGEAYHTPPSHALPLKIKQSGSIQEESLVHNLPKPDASSIQQVKSSENLHGGSALSCLGHVSKDLGKPELHDELCASILTGQEKMVEPQPHSGDDHNDSSARDLERAVFDKIVKKTMAFNSMEYGGRNGSGNGVQSGLEHNGPHWQPKSQQHNRFSHKDVSGQNLTAFSALHETHSQVPKPLPQRSLKDQTPEEKKSDQTHLQDVDATRKSIQPQGRKRGKNKQDSAVSANPSQHQNSGLAFYEPSVVSETKSRPPLSTNNRHGQHNSHTQNRTETLPDDKWNGGYNFKQQHHHPSNSYRQKQFGNGGGGSHAEGASFKQNSAEDTNNDDLQTAVRARFNERGQNHGGQRHFYRRASNHVVKVSASGGSFT